MNNIVVNSYAKINLFLDIVGKRTNGYHDIKSVMQQLELHDILDISQTNGEIQIFCDKFDIPLDRKNTCYKAVELIKEQYSIDKNVIIKIDKNIPTEAGLAGGSGNAAAVIKALNVLWGLNMSQNDMVKLGEKIGADVPFCLIGGTCLCEGIGEKITGLKPFIWDNILIVKPDFSISTPLAYSRVTPSEYNLNQDTRIFEYIENQQYKSVCESVSNTLETVAVDMFSQINDIKNKLLSLGAFSSLMTGSGSSIYAFFEDKESAIKAFDELKKDYKHIFFTKTISNEQ